MAARASARSRLSAQSRALLVDEDSGKKSNTLATSDFALAGASQDEADICAGLLEGISELSLSAREPEDQREFAELMLRQIVFFARKHDHCGLMGFALLKGGCTLASNP